MESQAFILIFLEKTFQKLSFHNTADNQTITNTHKVNGNNVKKCRFSCTYGLFFVILQLYGKECL